MGDLQLAEEQYLAAMEEEPGDYSARMAYGYLLAIKGDYQGAVYQWEEVLKLNPDEETAAYVNEMLEQAKFLMLHDEDVEENEK